MIRMDRLQKLIFSFYREDPHLQVLLQPLNTCRISRSRDFIFCDCLDSHHFEEVFKLTNYLIRPLALLGIGRTFVLRVMNLEERTFLIEINARDDFSGLKGTSLA